MTSLVEACVVPLSLGRALFVRRTAAGPGRGDFQVNFSPQDAAPRGDLLFKLCLQME